MKTTSLNLSLTKVEMDFSEDSTNPLSACTHCGKPTRGRESQFVEGRSRPARTRPACMGCSMKAAFAGSFQGGK